jgi:hypothetical protein
MRYPKVGDEQCVIARAANDEKTLMLATAYWAQVVGSKTGADIDDVYDAMLHVSQNWRKWDPMKGRFSDWAKKSLRTRLREIHRNRTNRERLAPMEPITDMTDPRTPDDPLEILIADETADLLMSGYGRRCKVCGEVKHRRAFPRTSRIAEIRPTCTACTERGK